MTWVVSFIASLLTTGNTPASPTSTMNIEITDLPSNQGKLLVALYAEDAEWLDEEVAFYTAFVAVTA